MASRDVRERMAQDVSQWLADGLVARDTHDLLRQRYGAGEFGIARAIKSLGIAGALIAFFGLLGLVASISGSKALAAFLMLLAGGILTAAGVRLAIDKLGRYALSSKAVLALGAVTATLGIGLALAATGIEDQQDIVLTGFLALIPIGFLAYRFGSTFLLVLGLVGFFHWVGSWTQMFGQSTYELSIQDPRLMSIAALIAVLVGIYHEKDLRYETGRFFQAYEALGLIYLNLSLLILTIEPVQRGEASLWITVWAVVAIGQIVSGAWLHNSLITGFGVTALAINVYTRFYETFWNQMDKGVFFLLGGMSLFLAGMLCEILLKEMRRSTR